MENCKLKGELPLVTSLANVRNCLLSTIPNCTVSYFVTDLQLSQFNVFLFQKVAAMIIFINYPQI